MTGCAWQVPLSEKLTDPRPGAYSVSASATAPGVALPPPSMESCIHTVVGNCSRRCPTSSAAVPDAALPPPSMESCIHAVVKGASNTVRRLQAADFFSFPLSGGRGGGGGG